jgi:hypothetical protein
MIPGMRDSEFPEQIVLRRQVQRKRVQQIVFDCPGVRREVSRNDRENDHGEESKEGEQS